MSHSEQINELFAAVAKAQGEMDPAIFDKENPHFKAKYASFTAVREATRKPLSKYGLALLQPIEIDANGSPVLHTILGHSSGQWVDSHYPLPSGAKPHEDGSAQTYARRRALSAMIGVATDDDDDANEAQKAAPPIAKPAVPPPPAETIKGPPHEIELGDSPDWAWFGYEMVRKSQSEEWVEWREANMINMERMKNEAAKAYGYMIAGIKKARPA